MFKLEKMLKKDVSRLAGKSRLRKNGPEAKRENREKREKFPFFDRVGFTTVSVSRNSWRTKIIDAI